MLHGSHQERTRPLLTTKLNIPPQRPHQVSRRHLIERLNQGLELGHKLALVSGPAGFGKTTLVGEWVRFLQADAGKEDQDQVSTAWLSLDEGDNDPARFLTYLVTTINRADGIESTMGKGALSMLRSPEPPPAEPILSSLINDVADSPDRRILVLDDYHLIDSPAVDEALSFLLDHVPPQFHLVVATRIDPNLPLARLRAGGQLTELRATELRFSSSEAVAFLNEVMGLNLSAEDITALETRTEGWVAGLQLAALVLQGAISRRGRENASSLIKSFTGSHRFVLDYLVDEVLEQQSADVKSFLLHTAILDRLTADLCNHLTGEENSQATLEALERANLFIVPLDGERLWYRYHHLFADLLRRRLRQTQPERLPILHIRAGEWFSQHGLNREAIKHSLAAGDYQGAAELIKAIAIEAIEQGEHTTVIRWIDSLPKESVKEQPYLCVLHAWALQLAGLLETAEARLVDAEQAMDNLKHRHGENADTILGLIHSHRAYITFMTGEHDETIAYARQALAQLPETAALIRAQTALYLGVAYRYQAQFESALVVYRETLPIAQRIGGKLAVLCFLHLGDLNRQMARLYQAKELYEQALAVTERHTGRSELPYTGYAYVCIGRILRQWNQLEDAYRSTSKGLALCRDWNVADILALSYIELAYVSQALGYEEEARSSMKEASQIMDSFSPWGSKLAAAHEAKMDLARGDLDAAERWAQTNDLVAEGDFEFHRENEYLVLVRVLVAQKRFDEAYALAEKIQRIAEEFGKGHTVLEGLILLARVSAGQDDIDRALVYLEKALVIGEPENFIRIFVDEGRSMARLLYEALSRGMAPGYVRRLLAAFPADEPEQVDLSVPHAEQAEPVEPLSERELEVLQLIAEGLTNREIATRLFLSLNTVKAHTRNIYGKLGVHSRTQAVARARDLVLLPPI